MKFKRVYVAGSYNADNVIKVLDNIKRGTKVSVALLKRGYVPFCPWLDFHFHWFGDISINEYYKYCMSWLEVSDCIYVLENSENSKGTQAEIKRAKELNIPVLREEDNPLRLKDDNWKEEYIKDIKSIPGSTVGTLEETEINDY